MLFLNERGVCVLFLGGVGFVDLEAWCVVVWGGLVCYGVWRGRVCVCFLFRRAAWVLFWFVVWFLGEVCVHGR